jgi:hypothetical protein
LAQSPVLHACIVMGGPAVAVHTAASTTTPLLKQWASRDWLPPPHDAEHVPNTPYCHWLPLAHAAVLQERCEAGAVPVHALATTAVCTLFCVC